MALLMTDCLFAPTWLCGLPGLELMQPRAVPVP